jgi:dienelactone hydrolase
VTLSSPSAKKRLTLRRIRITGWTALSFLLTAIVGFLAWSHVVYPADRDATIAVFRSQTVAITDHSGAITIIPTGEANALADSVFVFYPGGRVDPWAYLPPLADLASHTGIRVVIAKPPLSLAIADFRAVEDLARLAGDFDQIVTGGHSLGGVRGCLQAESPAVSHLVLLASYCANDLTARGDLHVLTVLGSQDSLTEPDQVTSSTTLLPPSHQSVTITGANHASFGAYGPQSGDGPASLSPESMFAQLTSVMLEFLNSPQRD